MVLAEDLRQSVLQAALQGKLTKQFETDSDVDEMLINIQAEKEKLIVDKKMKKEKPLPEIQEKDIPFDISDNWRWVKLNEIGEIVGGGTPKTSQAEFWDNGNIAWITPADMNGGGRYIKKGKKSITQLGLDNSSAKLFPKGSIVISSRAPIGYIAIAQNEASTSQGCKTFSAYMQELILSEYVYYAIQLRVPDMEKRATGTTFKEISGKGVGETIIPLPPVEEQQRIVDKINKIMQKIDEYEKIEKELEALKKEFPTNMKDALLQAAMQGKLTEQLKSDSSVDELLEEIKQEKKELIAQKKIKKEKPLPDIEEEEIPFDIPENWRWVRWRNLVYSIQYGYNAPAQESGKIKMVRISDIQDNLVNWNSVPYCDISDEEIETYLLKENDILFARTGGTVGKSFLVSNVPEDAIYAGYLIRTRYNAKLIPQYLKLFMESQLYWVQLQNGKTQGCQPNCNGQTLSKMMIPLPPIEEQQRIVERLEALLPLCEDLKKM